MAKEKPNKNIFPLNRRDWLVGTAGFLSGGLLKTAYDAIIPQNYSEAIVEEDGVLEEEIYEEDMEIEVPEDATKVLGLPPRELGERSPFETPRRKIMVPYHSGYSTTVSYTHLTLPTICSV